MPQILLVRHGQASFGAADYDQLSDIGVEQSAALGAWWASVGEPIDRVVIGNMRRHRQTAEAALNAMAADTTAVDRDLDVNQGFNEYDFQDVLLRYRPDFADTGAMTRLTAECEHPKKAFQRLFEAATARWMSGDSDPDYEEPWPVFRARCVDALQAVMDGPHRSVAVFTSGGPIGAAVQWVLGLNNTQMQSLNWVIANASVTRIIYRPGQVSLSYFNNYAHLQHADTQRLITYR